MNKKKTKTQSGITLVALIITIIVLLILAIVSIRAISEGGILGKSQNAVDSYEDKREEEENRMNEYENLIDQYHVGTGGSGGTTPAAGTKLYDAVVGNPTEYIGAMINGYTANGFSNWQIFDVDDTLKAVRIVPYCGGYGGLDTIEHYRYDKSKTSQENTNMVLNICKKYVNTRYSDEASSTLLPTELYDAYYYSLGNYGLLDGLSLGADGKLYVRSGGTPLEGREDCELDRAVVPFITLKSDVLVKDGGSKDTGYEIYK